MEGEDGDFLSNILLHGEGAHVAGLDEMHIPDTQDSSPRSDEVQAFIMRMKRSLDILYLNKTIL
jgi:hypothetical protein